MICEKLRDYFSFTRKERIGISILVALVILIFILPHFFELKKNRIDQAELDQFKKEIDRLKDAQGNDAAGLSNTENNSDNEHRKNYYEDKNSSEVDRKYSLHDFDPNTISQNQWKQFGIRDKTIHTIQNYLAKGGKFKVAADLKKVYGIREEDFNRLAPFIQIKDSKSHDRSYMYDKVIRKENTANIYSAKRFSIIDINTADSVDFTSLPGIGNKLASRIIHFRERLGGFYAIEQIAEIYGLSDSVFRLLKPFLSIRNDSVRKIDINAADIETLKQHPYIRWELAKAIVQYRNQHGMFKKPEDLLQIAIITTDNYKKMTPYIKW
ncbi:MAG: helix-hairpin-helix domain-containing protein [Bacteroidetes bacterium]|nr:helix-hairpin-helix domain-containing protein [Bacteroidota bacterium]